MPELCDSLRAEFCAQFAIRAHSWPSGTQSGTEL